MLGTRGGGEGARDIFAVEEIYVGCEKTEVAGKVFESHGVGDKVGFGGSVGKERIIR